MAVAGVPQRLGGRDLHRLVGALDDAELAAHEHVEGVRQEQDHERDHGRPAEGGDSWFLRRCQAETPSMMTAPVTREARTTWVKLQRKTGLVNRAKMLVSWGWPVLLSL